MSFTALLISAIINLAAPSERVLACTFPAQTPDEQPIRIRVESLPSLRDNGNIFRVRLLLGASGEFRGMAQPIDRTEDRDVLIRAETSDKTFYTIGLRDDGLAALNLLQLGETDPHRETRRGTCRDHKVLLNTWLTS